MGGAPTIDTPRILLRPFTLADVDEMTVICADPETMRFIGDRKPRSREQTEARITRSLEDYERFGMGLLAVIEKSSGALIGRCGLQPLPGTSHIEIGWLIARSRWGRGYATEAAHATLEWGFSRRRLDEIRAVAYEENEVSIGLMKKLGFQEKGRGFYYGNNCVEYAMTAASWRLQLSKENHRA